MLPRDPYQAMLNKMDVRFHVQWELERQVARSPTVEWSDFVASDFAVLKDCAKDSTPKVDEVVKAVMARKAGHVMVAAEAVSTAGTKSSKTRRLLVEVDREEESIRSNDLRGVGNSSADWAYGGRIAYSVLVQPVSLRSADCVRTVETSESDRHGIRDHQQSLPKGSHAAPIDTPDNPFSSSSTSKRANPDRLSFAMSLRAPDMPGKSFRLARRFGSRRVITFKLKDCSQKHRQDVLELFMGRVFILLGRPYRAVWAPPDRDAVFAVESGDEMDGVVLRNHKVLDPVMPLFSELMASEWSKLCLYSA